MKTYYKTSLQSILFWAFSLLVLILPTSQLIANHLSQAPSQNSSCIKSQNSNYPNSHNSNGTINQDSLALLNGAWVTKQIEPGVELRQIHFSNNNLFGSSQFISVIEIDFKSSKESDIKSNKTIESSSAFIIEPNPIQAKTIEIIASPVLIETNTLAMQNNAIAAINGSFFKFNYEHNTIDYNSVDYIRKNGEQLAPNTYTSNERSMHQKGALAIYDGELYILKADQLKEWEKYIQAAEVITTGPILRTNGVDEKLEKSSFYTTRHPRTAVAKKEDGNILFFTVDGRSSESAGMSLEELQATLRWLGASYIINLDGGGSTTMYVKEQPYNSTSTSSATNISDSTNIKNSTRTSNGIVNHPSDNKKFDHDGARKVANIIIIKL